MDPPKESPVSLAWIALLGGVVGLFSVHVGRVWEFTADDAAVAFSYARNVAEGHGYVLTPGAERVEAPESFLWVLLLSLATPLHVGHELLAKALGLVFGAGSLAAIACFPAAAYGRRPRAFDLLAPAVAACFAHVALWTVSGLENGLFSFLSALTLVAFAWEERDPTRTPWSAVAASALFAARPDGALTLVALLAVKVVRALRRSMSRQDVVWGFAVAVGVGSLELFRVAYFASALPNGSRAPGHLSLLPSSAGLSYVVGWARAYHLGALLAVTPVALLSLRAFGARAALALCVAAGFAVPLYRHGDWREEWRYLAYVTPLWCLLVAESLRVGLRAALGVVPPARRRVVAVVLSGLAAWGMAREATRAYGQRFAAVRAHTTPTFAPERQRARYFAAAARALRLRDASVLDPDVGGLSYDSGLRVIDALGVGDAAIARTRGVDPRGLLEVVFFERRPTFVHVDASALPPSPELDRLYLPLPAVVWGARAVGDHRVRRELLAAPWIELTDTPAAPLARGPDRFTFASEAVAPGESLSVSFVLAEADAASADATLVAIADDGSEASVPAPVAGGALDVGAFAAGERPLGWARLRLRAGQHRIAWRAGGRTVVLGTVRVAPDAGAAVSREAASRITSFLTHERVREARRVALRLLLRVEDVPNDEAAREGLARFARALALRAARLGDAGAYAIGADLARESRRFATTDPEANAALGRLVEQIADASRRAEQRGDVAAFSLARDAVLLDPRRSWMRRRAEAWRRAHRSTYDGRRDALAYEAACAALDVPSPDALDRAVVALGGVGRWREAAALSERTGHTSEDAGAALVALRGRLARGEFAEARALAERCGCEASRDAEVARALAVTGWGGAGSACPPRGGR